MKLTLIAVILGFLIDAVLGDPANIPHPVCLIGKVISFFENILRRIFPETPKGRRNAGRVMVLCVTLLSAAVPLLILTLCHIIHPILFFVMEVIMCWQIFAARCLKNEAKKVEKYLLSSDLAGARKQVDMLVGRDTSELTAEQVTKATVETVAENTTDGVIAPLLYMILAGPVGGFLYKSINTMDSMVGYKNDQYIDFGRCAAKLDDIANWLPARMAGIGMIVSAYLLGMDGRNAARTWVKYRFCHASPNSAQTESACAGALDVQLAGDAFYFGKLYKKPFIGEKIREIEAEDISKACSLMYADSILWLIILQVLVWTFHLAF